LSTVRHKDAFEEENERTDVAPKCSRVVDQDDTLWSFATYGTKRLDDHFHQSRVQIEWVYRDIHTESKTAVLPYKKASRSHQVSGASWLSKSWRSSALSVGQPKSPAFRDSNIMLVLIVASRVTRNDRVSSAVKGLVASEFPDLSPFAYREHLKASIPGICKKYADVMADDIGDCSASSRTPILSEMRPPS